MATNPLWAATTTAALLVVIMKNLVRKAIKTFGRVVVNGKLHHIDGRTLKTADQR